MICKGGRNKQDSLTYRKSIVNVQYRRSADDAGITGGCCTDISYAPVETIYIQYMAPTGRLVLVLPYDRLCRPFYASKSSGWVTVWASNFWISVPCFPQQCIIKTLITLDLRSI